MSGPKRSLIWSEGPRTFNPAEQTIGAAIKSVWNLGQSSAGGLTLVRIRGSISLWLEVVTTVGDAFGDVGVGIGIVSDDAFAIGATAMPGPLSDPGWDWMFVEYLSAMVGRSVSESELVGPLGEVRVPIDTKAMRKVKPNQTVFGMVETEDEIGAVTLVYSAMTRMLSKLG